MPQLQQIAATYASQFFWLLLVFGFLYFGIARAMLPKVGRVIEGRQAKIAGDLAEAQSAQTRASEAQARQEATLARARGEAQSILGAANNEVSSETSARLAELDNALGSRLAEAEARIAAAREAATGELDRVADEAAADIVTRLTGQSPAPESVASAVADARGRGY